VLDGRIADALGAANEASVLGLELTLLHARLDDVLAEVLEADGRVLRLRLLDIAVAAPDARGCQFGTSEVWVWDGITVLGAGCWPSV
jgi:hypothetical protein